MTSEKHTSVLIDAPYVLCCAGSDVCVCVCVCSALGNGTMWTALSGADYRTAARTESSGEWIMIRDHTYTAFVMTYKCPYTLLNN